MNLTENTFEGFSLEEVPFVHLRVHTAYSLLEGALKIKDIPMLLKTHKMPAIAMTDTGNLFGALEFSLSLAEQGIQPIIGCQLKLKSYKDEKSSFIKTTSPQKPSFDDIIVLLVATEQGYKNLLKLVSLSFLEKNPEDPPHISFEDLSQENITEGLIALTGGPQGGIGQLLLKNQDEKALDYLKKLQNLFKDRLYIEIMRHNLDDEKKTEQKFIDLAYSHKIPLVATNDVYFQDRSLYKSHDVLLCVSEGTYVYQENRRRVTAEHSLKSSQEMALLFKDLPEAYLNASVIAKRCCYKPEEHVPILPPFSTNGDYDEPELLKKMAHEGLLVRLQALNIENKVPYEERLVYELNVIIQMGYAGYFLIVADFIQWAKSHGIPVGPGRGSGAGSVVAWALTITDVDPIALNLIFERFLNPERVSMPDFDIDFCQDRREEVIEYVQKKYGKERVAQIITFGTLSSRAVIRDVGRVLGIPYPQVDKISKLIPNNPANPISLEDAVLHEPELQSLQKNDPMIRDLIEIAQDLEGLYRHASTHAAGLVIGDRPLQELIPLYRDPRSAMPVTQFSMKYVERAGLVKFDFLGLKTLTIIEDAAKLIRLKEIPFEISSIPLDDPKTFALLNRIETHGVFQLESAGMRDVLGQLKPDRFEELVALVALYRPGPMDDIPRYLACKHGHEKVVYGHPLLETILKETFGVMVYQEQVMQIAQVLGGYSLGSADLLRRAMGKKIKSEMDAQRQIFVTGALKNDVPESVAHEIFDQMAKFAGYGFNKSHSAPYALLLYQTAYLKANYPIEFLTATLCNDRANIDKLQDSCLEAKKMGIEILPPDINESDVLFSIQMNDKKEAIRYGLSAIKNVGEGSMESVVKERMQNGPYLSIFDFAARNTNKVMNKRQLEKMICAGVFDSLYPNRHELFENVDLLIKISNESHSKDENSHPSLFGIETNAPLKNEALQPFEEWSFFDKLQKEYEAVGFYLSTHPLENYLDSFKGMDISVASDLKNLKDSDSKIYKFAGVITGLQKKISKNGNAFAFLQLSDPTGLLEVTIFSELLARAKDLLQEGNLVCVTLLARGDGEAVRLTAQSIQLFEEILATQESEKIIKITTLEDLRTLEKIFKPFENKGKSTLKALLPVNLPPSMIQKNHSSSVLIFLGNSFALPPDFKENF
ncbi:MAG: DNA polymerase III subunit alpha [Proteobacteria bacterium]|nr:DNA polymerase III subunit alpha [Pseudomonadota bacterium]